MVAQAETGRTGTTLVTVREWLALIGAVVVILGGLLGGVRLVVAPLYTEMQALNGRMDRMDARMQEEFKVVREEFKAVRSDIAVLSERLTRVETLLERDADQADSAVAPETRP
ncbi:MAG: hypothetical protein OXP66_16250 [Candidatus Tectomicrobia bacterium]|nr:hypothetical protein [Candidatus Tectomicrobia bacterium]